MANGFAGKILSVGTTVLVFLWKYLKAFFKWMFSDLKNIIITTLLVAGVILFFKYMSLERKYDKDINSMTDTATVYINKVGELYKQTKLYSVTISDLKKENEELYNEVKNLRDNPIIVTKLEYVTRIDTLLIESDIYPSDSMTCAYTSPFYFEDEWCWIYGLSTFNMNTMKSDFVFDRIEFDGSMTVDIVNRNKSLFILAKSENPYTTVNNVYGVEVSNEMAEMIRKHYRRPWGIMVGAGLTGTVVNKKVKLVPGIHITIGYKLIDF